MNRKPGPYCPVCGADAPLRLLVWGMGKPFACKSCDAQLVAPKFTGFGYVVAGLLAFTLLRDANDSGWWPFVLFAGLMFIIGVFSWYSMKVRKVADESVSPETRDSV